MAQIVKLNYNINNNSGTLYDYNGNLMSEKSQGITISRVNPIPLDKFEIFSTLADAESYAEKNPVAYAGQQITVVEAIKNDDGDITGYNVQPYIINSAADENGSWLIPLSQGENMNDIELWEDWAPNA